MWMLFAIPAGVLGGFTSVIFLKLVMLIRASYKEIYDQIDEYLDQEDEKNEIQRQIDEDR